MLGAKGCLSAAPMQREVPPKGCEHQGEPRMPWQATLSSKGKRALSEVDVCTFCNLRTNTDEGSGLLWLRSHMRRFVTMNSVGLTGQPHNYMRAMAV